MVASELIWLTRNGKNVVLQIRDDVDFPLWHGRYHVSWVVVNWYVYKDVLDCEEECVMKDNVWPQRWVFLIMTCLSSFSLINEAFCGPTSKSQSWNTWSFHQVLLPVTFFYFQNWKRYMKGTYFGDLQHTWRPTTRDLNIILKDDLRIYQSMDKENGGMC
jgi:hypothetical protein